MFTVSGGVLLPHSHCKAVSRNVGKGCLTVKTQNFAEEGRPAQPVIPAPLYLSHRHTSQGSSDGSWEESEAGKGSLGQAQLLVSSLVTWILDTGCVEHMEEMGNHCQLYVYQTYV